jgi:hypothetical protein
MSVLDDFFALLETTEVMQQVIRSLKEEPAHLLGDICREYERTGQPVPDHHLNLVGYPSEASLKALISAELVHQQPGSRMALYCYEPTVKGMTQYEGLKARGFYQKRGTEGSGRT